MNFVLGIIALALAGSIFSQTPKLALETTVDRLCGKLRHSDYSIGESKNLRSVVVNLYPTVEEGECCDTGHPLASTVTGHWGSFHLQTKNVPGGLYWIEVQPKDRKYKILIRYTPKRYSDQLCYPTFWDVFDDGSFREGGVITVD